MTIRQKAETFELPLEIEVEAEEASEAHAVQLFTQQQAFLSPAHGTVSSVRIDPHIGC